MLDEGIFTFKQHQLIKVYLVFIDYSFRIKFCFYHFKDLLIFRHTHSQAHTHTAHTHKIGRASCRERVSSPV